MGISTTENGSGDQIDASVDRKCSIGKRSFQFEEIAWHRPGPL